MDDSNNTPPKSISVEVIDEDGKREIECLPLMITDFKNMHGGESVQVMLPEDFGDMEIAVVLVTKPIA